jgi:hypothetical protein
MKEKEEQQSGWDNSGADVFVLFACIRFAHIWKEKIIWQVKS